MRVQRENGIVTGGSVRTVQRKGRAAKVREHWVPLKAALAAALDDHASRMHRDATLFRIPQKAPQRLRDDLTAAGLPTVDTEGNLIDFHSLRHSGLTWWAEQGADVQTLKQLSGHKSSRMLDRYTDHRDADAALKRLSDIDAPSPLRMTGTDYHDVGIVRAPGRPLGAAADGVSTQGADLPAGAGKEVSHDATVTAGAEKRSRAVVSPRGESKTCAPAAQMGAAPVHSSPRHATSRYTEGRTGARVAEWTGLLNRRRGLPLPRVRIPPCPLFFRYCRASAGGIPRAGASRYRPPVMRPTPGEPPGSSGTAACGMD